MENVNSTKTAVLNYLRKKLFIGTFLEKPLKDFVKGAKSNSWKLKLLPNHDLYPANSLREIHDGDRKVVFNLGELMEWAAYFEFEDPALKAIEDLLKPNDVAIDIGTNIGTMLVGMSKKVGPSGQVIGFEPTQSRYDKCIERMNFNQIKNAHVHMIALGSKEGVVQLASPDPANLGRTKVLKNEINGPSVRCTTFDSWSKQNGLTKIDFIKMDVEGFEMEILNGMTNVLNNHKPILFIEVDDLNLRDQGYSAMQLINKLKEFNYQLYTIDGIQLTENLPAHFDVVAKPKN